MGYNSARVLCIPPCPTSMVIPPVAAEGLTIPGINTKVKPVLNMSLKASCDTCEVVTSFMLQIQPFLVSLPMPLCLLKCVMKIIAAFKSLSNMIGDLPAPDPTDPVKKLSMAVIECTKCVTGFSPGKFCALLRDLISLVIALLNCIKGLFSKILLLNLRVGLGAMDAEPTIVSASVCLANLVRVQTETMIIKTSTVALILQSVGFLLEFVPVSPINPSILTGVQTISIDTPLPQITAVLDELIGALTPIRVALDTCANNVP
jgi:hypothetical protein